MPYPKMKNPCSDKMFVDFLVDCMKLTVSTKILVKEIDKMTKRPCSICGEVDEAFKCEQCGKLVCADDIVGQKIDEDDFFMICKNCQERD